MIEAPDYLPLGSVVSLEGNEKKLLLIGRALLVENDDGEREYYDYVFCLYPEGLMGDTVIYSNHENVKTVHFKGFEDKENAEMIKTLKETVPTLDVPKAHPKPVEPW